MNYRKEYLWKNGNLGNKIMDGASYIPVLGLVFDDILDKKIKTKLKDNPLEIEKFKNRPAFKGIYHLIASALIALSISNNYPELKSSKEKSDVGPSSLENIIKVIGNNNNNNDNNSSKTFNYLDYFA